MIYQAGIRAACTLDGRLKHPEIHRLEVAGGECIALDWYPAQPQAPAVLFVHGLGSHRRGEKARYFARQFNLAGRAFAALDLRGHGDSDGAVREMTMSRLLADVSVAASWTSARAASGGSTLVGASMGAALVAWHAARNPETAEALILLSPSLRFPVALTEGLAPEALHHWRSSGARRFVSEWIDLEIGCALLSDAAHYDPAELCQHLATPALLVHGLHDTTIPWEQSAQFMRSCMRAPAALFLVGDGDHRLTAHKELLFAVFRAWLEGDSAALSQRGDGT
jgi:pimeloyl-ACP methyl ester carboxylesterase